jgi:hypothetical protein
VVGSEDDEHNVFAFLSRMYRFDHKKFHRASVRHCLAVDFGFKSGTGHATVGYPSDLLNRTSTGVLKNPDRY